MKIAIVHYHARPGGVTRVVERTVEAIGDRAHCLFFTGEAARNETPIQKKIRVVPGLAYAMGKKSPPIELTRHVRGAFGGEPDIWHIHNHGLGKNTALTQEVSNLAMAGKKLLLQIHDFAEDGRPDNYASLGKLKSRLYPIAPHVHYAVLNTRDYSFLKQAGIPESNLHVLPDSVSPFPVAQRVQPNAQPLFVYPCRAIRRKNIGEILLWSALMPEARFAITLAPKNPDAKPIYEGWVSFAAELGLAVDFDAGAVTPLHEMFARADAVITTSVAEGVGLAFLEPWLAGKPLVGRNLPEITTDLEPCGLDLSNLYNGLPVPLVSPGWDIESAFFQTLEAKLRASYAAYGREWNDLFFVTAKAELVRNGCVDFGTLDESMQRILIRAVRSNPGLLNFSLQPAKAMASNRTITETSFGVACYRTQLLSIYNTLQAANPGSVQYANSDTLLEAFLNPARFNLLRT